jgi:hypothetical protein
VTDHVLYPSPLQRAILTPPLFRLLRACYRARAHGLEALPTDRPVRAPEAYDVLRPWLSHRGRLARIGDAPRLHVSAEPHLTM